MSFIIERFGNVYLPQYEPAQDIGTGEIRIEAIDSPRGGAFDMNGQDTSFRGGYGLSTRGILVNGTSGSTLGVQFSNWRAMLGKKERLYRVNDDDDSSEWAWARLQKCDVVREPKHKTWLEIDLSFYIFSSLWRGTAHSGWEFDEGNLFDDGLYFDAATPIELTADGSTTVTVNNGGNTVVRDVDISITAVSSEITSVTISKAGETNFTWTGTIAVGTQLKISCGGLSVRNNGVDAYSGFVLNPALHKIDDWLRLDPGDNTIVITIAGGAGEDKSTADISYYDGWA